jgi:hypothetical protein
LAVWGEGVGSHRKRPVRKVYGLAYQLIDLVQGQWLAYALGRMPLTEINRPTSDSREISQEEWAASGWGQDVEWVGVRP